MPRALRLTSTARWWPSTLWQTTTLEVERDGQRLLVDPGIAPWEVEEVALAGEAPVSEVFLTHADWDHVMGVGFFPEARVTAGEAAAAAIASGAARGEVEVEGGRYCIPLEHLDRLRVDRALAAPVEAWLGRCRAVVHEARGHTPHGLTAWLPDEGLLVVGDHLSPLELPMAGDSPARYVETLRMLVGLIERERPDHVVVGHGRPQTPEAALAVAHEDLAYLEAVVAHARAGRGPDEAAVIPHASRSVEDDEVHTANVTRACELAAAS